MSELYQGLCVGGPRHGQMINWRRPVMQVSTIPNNPWDVGEVEPDEIGMRTRSITYRHNLTPDGKGIWEMETRKEANGG